MKALQGLGPWPIFVAVAMLAGLVLLRMWRVRRRRHLAVRREVQRLQREFAVRDALESQEDPQV
jgi:hypothetical protein